METHRDRRRILQRLHARHRQQDHALRRIAPFRVRRVLDVAVGAPAVDATHQPPHLVVDTGGALHAGELAMPTALRRRLARRSAIEVEPPCPRALDDAQRRILHHRRVPAHVLAARPAQRGHAAPRRRLLLAAVGQPIAIAPATATSTRSRRCRSPRRRDIPRGRASRGPRSSTRRSRSRACRRAHASTPPSRRLPQARPWPRTRSSPRPPRAVPRRAAPNGIGAVRSWTRQHSWVSSTTQTTSIGERATTPQAAHPRRFRRWARRLRRLDGPAAC